VMGAIYAAIALLLGGVFVQKAWQLMQTPEDLQVARSVFKYSILYLMLLCAGMALDSLPATHHLTEAIATNLQTFVGALTLHS